MRLVPFLPAVVVLVSVSGPAQERQALPPTLEPTPGLRNAPGPVASNPATGVTTVAPSAQITSSTSSSKQFIIYGADLQTRGAFCLLCEDIAASLGRLLKDDGRFALPVVVVLKTPPNTNPADPVITTSFSQLAYGGFHLQLNAELRQEFNAEEFSQELVRMLLAERILRNHKEVQTTRSQLLSGWLLTGVTQAMEFRKRSRPSALFAAVFRSGQVYSIDRILEANPKELDALARGIYETSSCALVLALLEQPDGGLRFSRFLNALANGKKGDRELLQEHFPTLGISKNSLEKWWTLQMAALATPSTFESMTYVQTEEALATALTFRLPESQATPRATASRNGGGATEPTAPAEATPEEKKSRGWLWFGKKDKDTPEPATPEPPAPAAEGTPAPAEEKKPETRPALPFTGGRKIAAPAATPKEGVDGAPATGGTPAAPAALAEKKSRGGFFGLFGRKKEEPAPPAPAPATPAKPASAEPAKKPEVRKAEAAKPAPTPAPAQAAAKDKAPPAGEPAPEPAPVELVGPPAPPTPEALAFGPPPAPGPLLALPVEKKDGPLDITMPESAGERRPGEAVPEGLSPVPPTPAEISANPTLMPLPFLPEPTPAPPEMPVEAGPPLPELGKAPDPDLLPLEDFAKLGKRKDRMDVLKRTLNQINSVKLRAHPLYRPVIGDYASVVQNLILGRETGVAEQIATIRKQHLAVREQARAVESYVDWYEAAQTQSYSHVFDDYLKLRDELERDAIPRTDALSRYLDAVQREFEEE